MIQNLYGNLESITGDQRRDKYEQLEKDLMEIEAAKSLRNAMRPMATILTKNSQISTRSQLTGQVKARLRKLLFNLLGERSKELLIEGNDIITKKVNKWSTILIRMKEQNIRSR